MKRITSTMEEFTSRLYSEWLPNFCHAPHRNYSTDGFEVKSISKLTDFDSRWFLHAVNDGLVAELNGFFTAPLSKAKEQIFWTGRKTINPRPLTLWIEPIITMGALARLNKEFGWPIEKLGMQSQTWAFDLVGYGNTSIEEKMICEVKKSPKEIDVLLRFMNQYCSKAPLPIEPNDSKERNAYRKVQGVRRSWPSFFWALGPKGEGKVYCVRRVGDSQCFYLDRVDESTLQYQKD